MCKTLYPEKLTVTVMTTSTGTPFSSVGVNNHCRTASSAASSRPGTLRRICAFLTVPSLAMIGFENHDAAEVRRLLHLDRPA